MGQRANLIVLRSGGWSMHYTHWRADTLDADLFWGPAYATVFIQAQKPCDPNAWLDEVWAEGGAVVDHDARLLLWFGGGDVRAEVPLRRAQLDLMRHAWPGWEVRWAREGVVDIAAQAGVAKEAVLSDGDWSSIALDLSPPQERDWSQCIGAHRAACGKLFLYPLGVGVEEYVDVGPDLLDTAGPAGLAELDWAEWSADFPTGGFFADEATHTLSFWSGWPMPDAVARAEERWPGWSIRCHWDYYGLWAANVGPTLRLSEPDVVSLRERVRQRLLRRTGESGACSIEDLARRWDAWNATPLEENPNAPEAAWIDLPLERKQAMLDAAFTGDPMPPAFGV